MRRAEIFKKIIGALRFVTRLLVTRCSIPDISLGEWEIPDVFCEEVQGRAHSIHQCLRLGPEGTHAHEAALLFFGDLL